MAKSLEPLHAVALQLRLVEAEAKRLREARDAMIVMLLEEHTTDAVAEAALVRQPRVVQIRKARLA